MIVHGEASFVIGYGDIYSSFDRNRISEFQRYDSKSILTIDPFFQLQELLGITYLAKSKQVHGIGGIIIESTNDLPIPFKKEADYLITNCPGIGLAVATGDCLPVIFYDPEHHTAGIAHAGWRGIANGIIKEIVCKMDEQYGTDPKKLNVYLGPAAGSCCYEVDRDFLEHFSHLPYKNEIFFDEDGRYYFDLTECVLQSLQRMGVDSQTCFTTYNHCTICTSHYASHRRLNNPWRQLTTISLR